MKLGKTEAGIATFFGAVAIGVIVVAFGGGAVATVAAAIVTGEGKLGKESRR